MIYNILVIDSEENKSINNEFLNLLESKELFYATNEDMLSWFFIAQEIHAIILNTEILTLDTLYSILNINSLKSIDIAIFVIGKYTQASFEDNTPLIYDFIDITTNKKIALSKINFCKNLYHKELRHETNIKKLLYIDNLTKLPNRTKLIKDIQDEVGINALAIIDINSFKEINEFFGLTIGDNILKSIVGLIDDLIKFIKDKVHLYKFSADVYCLANMGLNKEEFEEIILYILGSIDSKIFKEDGHDIMLRAKAGVTFSDKKNKLITADMALKEAKKNNQDYMIFYDELDNLNKYQYNMLWTKKLKHALDTNNIVVYYQPLVNNNTLKVDKYECLVRMLDGEDVIAPFFFLDISKKANQYKNITKIVIDKAFKEFDKLDFEFSINISYEDIEDKYFLYYIKSKLKKYNVATRVVWEILEDESIKDYDILLNFIKEIKALGCKVAIDDFGSGYSNFEHLLKMDVDYLKIDASLIKYIADDENSYKIVKTIIDFAKSLNLQTIAEYVENEKIFNITKKLGTNYSQGYYFSKPIPKPTLESF